MQILLTPYISVLSSGWRLFKVGGGMNLGVKNLLPVLFLLVNAWWVHAFSCFKRKDVMMGYYVR